MEASPWALMDFAPATATALLARSLSYFRPFAGDLRAAGLGETAFFSDRLAPVAADLVLGFATADIAGALAPGFGAEALSALVRAALRAALPRSFVRSGSPYSWPLAGGGGNILPFTRVRSWPVSLPFASRIGYWPE